MTVDPAVLADPDTLAEWADDVLGTVGDEKCYNPTVQVAVPSTSDPFPWDCTRANSRGPDKTRIVLTSVLMGDSPRAPVRRMDVLREAFGQPDTSDEMLATRVCDRYPEMLQTIDRADEPVKFKPARRAVSLARLSIRSMHDSKLLPWVGADLPPVGETSLLPAERYEAIFGRCVALGTDRQRALAVMLLAEHRQTLLANGTTTSVGKRIAGNGGQSVVATTQRFASPGVVDRERAKFEGVMDVVADGGPFVWAAFTLPRECADSAVHSYAVLPDALDRFHTRCATDPADPSKPSRPGERPAYVAVTDAQSRSGWCHRHVLYPGRARLYDAAGLADEWEAYVRRDWADLVGAPPDVEPQVSLEVVRSPSRFEEVREYMRGPFTRLRALASMSVEGLQELAGRLESGGASDRDRELAAMTAMWPGERRVWSASADVRSSARVESAERGGEA